MPTNLTDTSSFDTVTGPTGSDIRNAASVRSALQTVANRTRFLYDRTTPLADLAALKALAAPADGTVRLVKARGVYVFDSLSVVAEALPYIVAPDAGSGRWLHDFAGFWKTTRSVFQLPVPMPPHGNWAMQDVPPGIVSGGSSTLHLALPEVHDAATLESIDIVWRPASGHAALPDVFPRAELWSVDTAGSIDSLFGTGSTPIDSSPVNVGAYEVLQTKNMVVDPGTVIDKASKYYFVTLLGESGANSINNGLRIVGMKLNFTNIPDLRAP